MIYLNIIRKTAFFNPISGNFVILFPFSAECQESETEILKNEVFFGFPIDFFEKSSILVKHFSECAPVAQLDRASASGVEGREFKSRRVHHLLSSIYDFPVLRFFTAGNIPLRSDEYR